MVKHAGEEKASQENQGPRPAAGPAASHEARGPCETQTDPGAVPAVPDAEQGRVQQVGVRPADRPHPQREPGAPGAAGS